MSDEEKLIEELKGIEDLQDRINRVAQDFESGGNAYSKINPWDLGELLGLDWYNTADWSRSFWAIRSEIEDDDFERPYAENVSLLEGKLPTDRYRFLQSKSAEILDNGLKQDLPLTKKEERILRDAYAQSCASGSDLVVAETSLYSAKGEELTFQVCIGCGGEPSDPCSPYELENGGGCDLDSYVEID